MKEITSKEEIEELLKSKKPVAMFMYAAWCPHCKVMHEPWSELEKEDNGKTEFIKMESENIPSDIPMNGFPTFIYVKNGSVQKKVSGEMPKEELKKKLLGGLRGGRTKSRRGGTRRLRRGVRKVTH